MTAIDKGGVGKSTFNIHLVDWALARGQRLVAFDPDMANSSFARFFSDRDGDGKLRPEPFMRFINIADDTSLDQITRAVEAESPLCVVDGIAAQQRVFLDWIDEIGLFERKGEMGLDITFVRIADEDADTVDQCANAVLRVGDKVDWVLVKNHKTVEQTTIFDKATVRQALQDMGAIEVVLPRLKGHLVSLIQSKSLPLSRAIAHPEVYTNDRERLRAYQAQVWGGLDTAARYLLPGNGAQTATT